MKRLPEEIQDAFENENVVAELSDSLFNNVWINYTQDVIDNKAHKDRGGILYSL